MRVILRSEHVIIVSPYSPHRLKGLRGLGFRV